MMRSLREWLDGAARVLASSPEFSEDSGASPRREAEFLLCHALGLTREALVTRARESLPPDAEGELNALLARRAGGGFDVGEIFHRPAGRVTAAVWNSPGVLI